MGHQLIVTILGAKDLPAREDGRPRNPYVKIYFLPDRRCTFSVAGICSIRSVTFIQKYQLDLHFTSRRLNFKQDKYRAFKSLKLKIKMKPWLSCSVHYDVKLYGYLISLFSDKSKRRTKTVKKSLEPKWTQTFMYSPVHRREFRERMLEITLWDQARVREEESEFLGEVNMVNTLDNMCTV